MGASQFSLRPMEPRQPSRIRLPDGDDLPSNLEDAPVNRISENTGISASSTEPTRGRREIDRESLRRSTLSIFPIREDTERRVNGSSSQSLTEGNNSGRHENYTSNRSSSVSNAAQIEPGIESSGSESRTTTPGEIKTDRSKLLSHHSEETPKNCFLDKTRSCGPDCMAFDTHWKSSQPCSILRTFKITTNLPIPPSPPKVKL